MHNRECTNTPSFPTSLYLSILIQNKKKTKVQSDNIMYSVSMFKLFSGLSLEKNKYLKFNTEQT